MEYYVKFLLFPIILLCLYGRKLKYQIQVEEFELNFIERYLVKKYFYIFCFSLVILVFQELLFAPLPESGDQGALAVEYILLGVFVFFCGVLYYVYELVEETEKLRAHINETLD